MLRKKVFIILGFLLLFLEGAFAGCGSWSFPWYVIWILLGWFISFGFSVHGLLLFFLAKRKFALLRTLPFVFLTSWILFSITT